MFSSKIKLDDDLLRKCKEHAQGAGYSSVEEFIHHALDSALEKASPQSSDDEEKVLDRLKGLGYIE